MRRRPALTHPLTQEQQQTLHRLLPEIRHLTQLVRYKFKREHLIDNDLDAMVAEAVILVSQLVVTNAIDLNHPNYKSYMYLRIRDYLRRWVRANNRMPLKSRPNGRRIPRIYYLRTTKEDA